MSTNIHFSVQYTSLRDQHSAILWQMTTAHGNLLKRLQMQLKEVTEQILTSDWTYTNKSS